MTTEVHRQGVANLREQIRNLEAQNGMLLALGYEAVRKLRDEVDGLSLRNQNLLVSNNELISRWRELRDILWVLVADIDYTQEEMMKAFDDGRQLLGLAVEEAPPPDEPDGQHEGETNGRTQMDGQPGEDVAGAEAGEPQGRRPHRRRRPGNDPD